MPERLEGRGAKAPIAVLGIPWLEIQCLWRPMLADLSVYGSRNGPLIPLSLLFAPGVVVIGAYPPPPTKKQKRGRGARAVGAVGGSPSLRTGAAARRLRGTGFRTGSFRSPKGSTIAVGKTSSALRIRSLAATRINVSPHGPKAQ